MTRTLLAIVAASIWLISMASADPRCEGRKDVVEACFDLRGRVSVSNGTPFVRIWPVGTKRLLGVETIIDEIGGEGETFSGPENLKKWLDPYSRIFADLRVCPLSEERAGYLRTVCIEAAHNLRIERISDESAEIEFIYVSETDKEVR